MASTIKLTKAVEHPDGRFECIFEINGAGGQGRVWASKQDALDILLGLEGEDALIGYLLARWNAVSTDFKNAAVIQGKVLSIDWSRVNVISIN